jgi:hypothetical protein
MGFEVSAFVDLPAALRALARHDFSVERWLAAFEAKPKVEDADFTILMVLANCASYDPDPSVPLGIRLPVDTRTCELIPERWANWLSWDPVQMAEGAAEGLKGMKALFIDCGDTDQYNLVYGARRLHAILERLGVAHRYEEFPDNHTSVDYRMDLSLPFLAKALT